ncbi:zinc finger, C2H5-type domain containing protein [Pseudohyphozyma bogoriensis]|nr:zinc finger, C2H5-type domain containing protein [Pseudohyphozyma bogoriensis]
MMAANFGHGGYNSHDHHQQHQQPPPAHDETYAVPYASSSAQTTSTPQLQQQPYLPYSPSPSIGAPVEQTLPPAHSQNTVAAFQHFAAPPPAPPSNPSPAMVQGMPQTMPQGIPIMAMGPGGVPMMMMALPQAAFAHFQGFPASTPAPPPAVAAPAPAPVPQQHQNQGQPQSFDAPGGTYYFVPNPAAGHSGATTGGVEDNGQERTVLGYGRGKKTGGVGKYQVKRFVCPQPDCGRAFARNFNMQSHLKSHLGIRDFSCPVCPKKFSRRHDRARHCAAVHDVHEESSGRRNASGLVAGRDLEHDLDHHTDSHPINSQEEFV